MKKVLMCSEYSKYSTGYSIYTKELLSRLKDKYEVAELASYCKDDDATRFSVPWRVYPVEPGKKDEEGQRKYGSDPINQFGSWRFEEVCLDFKPDICIAIRDWWYDEFIERSPFRRMFHWVEMPTVDSIPQKEQWLSTYANTDGCFTYTDWGADILREHGIKVIDSAPPAASDDFCPLDREKVKKSLGLGDTFIFGMVARNQPRKLFPQLFQTFREFLDTGKKALLYCHTSFPDKGWDLPFWLKHYNLASKVLFTYSCDQCKYSYPTFFSDINTVCPKCNKNTAKCTNYNNSISNKTLNVIYNCIDLYISLSSKEGFGMPVVEAAAAGTPVCGTDYSALSDNVRKLSGFPIDVLDYTVEVETGTFRAVPDRKHLLTIMNTVFDMTPEQRSNLRDITRQSYLKHYNWDVTAQKWSNYFETLPKKNLWNSPPLLYTPNTIQPKTSNNLYVRWLIGEVLCRPDLLNSYFELRLLRDLNYGMTLGGTNGCLLNEGLGTKYEPFTREKAYEHMLYLVNKHNHWEKLRCKI